MHRSGTSVVARLLETLGLFTGHSQESNSESTFFLRLNEWIMSEANASWDNPYCFRFLNDYFKVHIVSLLDSMLCGAGRAEFLGPDRMGRYANIRDIDVPWGWKDPRNTFTFEIWKELFPEARVLHVYRNPVDVAASLRNREKRRQGIINQIVNEHGVEELLRRRLKIQTSMRVEDLEEGINLWREYMGQIVRISGQYRESFLHVKYEELLSDPGAILCHMAEFAGLAPNEGQFLEAEQMLDSRRRYAFANDPVLVSLHESIVEDILVSKFGYDDVGLVQCVDSLSR